MIRSISLFLMTLLIFGTTAICGDAVIAQQTLAQKLQKRMDALVNEAKDFKKDGQLMKARANWRFVWRAASFGQLDSAS